MHTAIVKDFSVSLATGFVEPVPWGELAPAGFARQALLQFSGYGLQARDLFHREGDKLFDYELSFSLFQRHATFRLGSEGGTIVFRNARGTKDIGIIVDCFMRAQECMPTGRIRDHKLELYLHASLASNQERDEFLRAFCPREGNFSAGGVVFYFSQDAEFGESRLMLDRSIGFADGVFVNWTTQVAQLNQSVCAKMPETLNRFGLDLGLKLKIVSDEA